MISSVISKTLVDDRKSHSMSSRFYRSAVFDFFSTLTRNTLVIDDRGKKFYFGEAVGATPIVGHIRVEHPGAYKKFLCGGSIGAAEAYIDNLWSSTNLLNVIQVFSSNIDQLNSFDSRISLWKRLLLFVLHRMHTNSVSRSKSNIAAHYDLSNAFFRLILDATMMYSSAVFPNKNASLEEASVYKLDQVCEKLRLGPSDHLLEIGTGWGGLAVHAARHYGCRVTTTTLSTQQYAYVDALIKKQGLEDRITLLLKDYRYLEGVYDKLVSIEMIEAVGHKYYPDYFSTCNRLLKPDGLMLIQSITIADQRYRQSLESVDFIQKYIFPGGSLPSNEVIATSVARFTDMQIINLEDITRHYATTLEHWRANFLGNLEKVRALDFNETFIRKWEYYLCYCEGGFRQRIIGTVQLLLAKPRYCDAE